MQERQAVHHVAQVLLQLQQRKVPLLLAPPRYLVLQRPVVQCDEQPDPLLVVLEEQELDDVVVEGKCGEDGNLGEEHVGHDGAVEDELLHGTAPAVDVDRIDHGEAAAWPGDLLRHAHVAEVDHPLVALRLRLGRRDALPQAVVVVLKHLDLPLHQLQLQVLVALGEEAADVVEAGLTGGGDGQLALLLARDGARGHCCRSGRSEGSLTLLLGSLLLGTPLGGLHLLVGPVHPLDSLQLLLAVHLLLTRNLELDLAAAGDDGHEALGGGDPTLGLCELRIEETAVPLAVGPLLLELVHEFGVDLGSRRRGGDGECLVRAVEELHAKYH
mmetsp:Transcript_17728/g.68765  ORF Transcript_17728/g.68765 Transcript_17728/m.68765 type:complete len:328 (-) Transcript_17728:1712-2695(-)